MTRRVLWIHQNFVSTRETGNSRPVRILTALSRAGFTVDVVVPAHGYLEQPARDAQAARNTVVRDEQSDGVVVHRLPVEAGVSVAARRRSFLRFAWSSWRYARGLGTFDVIYCTTPPPSQILAGLALAFTRRTPVVYEVRDVWPAFIVAAGTLRSRLAALVMEWTEACAMHAATRVVSVSPSYVPYLLACGVRRDRLSVIPTGGDPAWNAPAAAGREWRRAHGLEDRFVVLYAGSFNETYGLDGVVAAAELVARTRPDIVFVFQGDGRVRARLEQAASAGQNVRVLAAVPRDGLGPALAGADAGLVSLGPAPLLSAMLPAKLFEYMAAGLPVVCGARGMPGAIVEAARAGVVAERAGAQSLSDAVLALASASESERRAMGERGRAWVMQHLFAGDMGERVAAVVASAVERGRVPRGRCVGAMGRATHAVVTRRADRALARHYRKNLDGMAARELRAWLAETAQGAAR